MLRSVAIQRFRPLAGLHPIASGCIGKSTVQVQFECSRKPRGDDEFVDPFDLALRQCVHKVPVRIERESGAVVAPSVAR